MITRMKFALGSALIILAGTACATIEAEKKPAPLTVDEEAALIEESVPFADEEEFSNLEEIARPSHGMTFEEHRAINPPPPENLSAELQGDGILLTWEPAGPVLLEHFYGDDVLYYKLFRRTGDTLDYMQVDSPTETSYLDEDVEPGATYHYTVVEVHSALANGEIDGERPNDLSVAIRIENDALILLVIEPSTFSPEEETRNAEEAVVPSDGMTFEEHLAIHPPPPEGLHAAPEGDSILLTWEPAGPVMVEHFYGDDVLYYKILRWSTSLLGLSHEQIATTTETLYLDRNVTAGVRYYYRIVEVRASSAAGEVDSPPSLEMSTVAP